MEIPKDSHFLPTESECSAMNQSFVLKDCKFQQGLNVLLVAFLVRAVVRKGTGSPYLLLEHKTSLRGKAD